MTVSSWDELTTLARAARAADWFDEEERDYKLEIAGRVKSALETARDDGEWLSRLDELFRLDSYNLTNWRQNRWLLDWGHKGPHLRGVLATFLDPGDSALERFDRFAQLAATDEVAKGSAASVLAFGSIFNFAAEPDSLPLVRARVFEAVERRVGWETAASATPTERYENHLAFAYEARRRMEAADVPIRDMVDVQGVLFVLSQQAGEQLQRLAELGHEAAVEAWNVRPEDPAIDTDGRGISREDVLEAIREYRDLGGDEFRAKHGFGRSLKYRLIHEGEAYDSKAIYGVAFGYAHPEQGSLGSDDFTGGESSVVRPLRKLGFDVRAESDVDSHGGEVAGATEAPVMHLLMRWSASREPNTIALHTSVASQHGAVWWGKLGNPAGRSAMSAVNIARIENQLAAGTPTSLYLYRPGETWRARLEAIQTDRPDAETELIPEYYRNQIGEHHLWFKLRDFEQIGEDYPERKLGLYGTSEPNRMARALRGQASLLYVDERDSDSLPRLWWVNQGTSLKRSRAGGYLWAPQLDKAGRGQGHWESLKQARPGDVVLNFASGSIRGVSRVDAEAVDAERPDPVADARWGEQGWLVGIDYHELSEPIPLTDIPERWRREEGGPFTVSGGPKQGYFYPLSERFARQLVSEFPQLRLLGSSEGPAPNYEPPGFDAIAEFVADQGMSLATRLLRRYHLSLTTRGFVVLSGISGTGKTWLAELYAEAVGAVHLLVAVAPNWTTNEDLLGYLNPLTGEYHHTPFSRFLREAAEEYEAAGRQGRAARPFHLTLDEMNLARVEYYFARFLSAMEVRARNETAPIELAPGHEVLLTPNLFFTGTVNVDETTHGFADKVYDRAQLLELVVPRGDLVAHMDEAPYAESVMDVWDAVEPIAPFAFRVLDEFAAYIGAAENLGVPWQEAVDEQLLQKVLPKLKGADLRLGQALADFAEASDAYPLSQQKATAMLEDFKQHGFASFF